MCGLFGFIGVAPMQKGIMVALAEQAGRRGPQAWGVSWYRKHVIITLHYAASLKDDLDRFATMIPLDAHALIGQTRLCTSGDYHDTSNNQPITAGDGPIYNAVAIAHNGIVYNAADLAQKYHMRLYSENDSEVIAHLIAHGEGNLLERTNFALSEIDGRSPFALLVLSKQGMVIARRGHPLYLLEIAGSTYICSRPFYPIFEYMAPENKALFIPMPGESQKREMVTLLPPARRGVG